MAFALPHWPHMWQWMTLSISFVHGSAVAAHLILVRSPKELNESGYGQGTSDTVHDCLVLGRCP